MKTLGKLILPAAVVILVPTAASAGERVTDAAVGAVAGAVVAGPVGFVGGGLIGYVAGPQIACDLGVNRCYRHVRYHRSGYGPASVPAPRRAERGEHFRGPGDLGTREDHGNY